MNPFRKLSRQNPGGLIRSLVFFVLFYLYLYIEVDLRLIYHGNGASVRWPVFFLGWQFFQEFLSYPGGLVEYFSAFLFQFFYYSWAGAIVVTVLAWLMCVCTGRYIEALNSPRLRWIRFVPPVLLLILYTQYTYYLVTIAAVLAAMFFACLYIKIAPVSKLFRLALFLILSIILYAAAGGAFLVYAALCAIYEGLFMGRWRIGLACLLSAFIIPYILGLVVFKVSFGEAFGSLLPFFWKTSSDDLHKSFVLTIVYALCLFLPLAAMSLGLWRFFAGSPFRSTGRLDADKEPPAKAGKTAKEKLQSKSSGPGARILSWYAGKPILKWTVKSLLLFVLAGTAVLFSRDSRIKAVFAVDYYSYHKMWPQVLEAAVDYPENYFIIHAVNRALYHTGRLGYQMFSCPQYCDLLFLTAEGTGAQHWKRFGTYIDLGLVNMAEKSVSESLEQLGERPAVLRQLALINMVKGNSGAAGVYLGALGKTLFHADWANDFLKRLESDPNLSNDREIEQLRRVMMKKNYNFIAYITESNASEFEVLLLDLLEVNKKNRMAFEYLMAYYLLSKQLDKFVQNIDRLSDFDYPQIPRHYEEAILIYQKLMNREIDLRGRHISSISRQRFRNCVETLKRCDGMDREFVFNKLAAEYGDSYFLYYYLYEIQK